MKMHRMAVAASLALFCSGAAYAGKGNGAEGSAAVGFGDLTISADSLKGRIKADVSIEPALPKSYGKPKPVEWVSINGGSFTMGTDNGNFEFRNAKPAHRVTIGTFSMSKTAVTVEQYAECVSKGACTVPNTGGYCSWGVPGRELHPVDCVDWAQADQYARFKGARLPSEAEWEYAVSGGGRPQAFPWGDIYQTPSCDKVVMFVNDGGTGCGKGTTWPVCSKPAGNTGQGLCDMQGNARQWVQDTYQPSYAGAPVDGRAYEGEGDSHVVRGSSYAENRYVNMVGNFRSYMPTGSRYSGLGFRIAR